MVRAGASKLASTVGRAATEVAGVHLPPVSLDDKWLELAPTDFRIHNPEKQFRGLESYYMLCIMNALRFAIIY